MRWLVLFAVIPALAAAQDGASGTDWGSKTIELKYLDPEQLRDVFAGRSFVMQTNRDLKTLTVSGPAQFLQDVDQTAKRLDVAPAATPDIEVTVYLLTANVQGASPNDLPACRP